MAITPAVARPLAGDAHRRTETSHIDGAVAALAMRRGWVCPERKSALAAAAGPASRRRDKSAGFAPHFARRAHGRNEPPATAADAKTIGRIRTASA
jgi:hypothetical protein